MIPLYKALFFDRICFVVVIPQENKTPNFNIGTFEGALLLRDALLRRLKNIKKDEKMTDKIFSALRFATNAHSGQYRKSTKIPYIVHPVQVMQYLIQYGASDDAVAAGILHDTLEDTPVTESDLRKNFGDRITDLVIGASEPDKSLSWEKRKEHTLNTLQQLTDTEQLMVICADKLSNISSIASDLKTQGEKVWTRFNRGYEQQKWYYCGLAEIFAKHAKTSQLFQEYIQKTRHVFCK